MSLVIKKIIDLDSLGDEYKDISLIFRSIPARDLPQIIKENDAADEKTDKLILNFIEVLQKYFISGKQADKEITSEDIGSLDQEALLHCYQIITGQKIDPKVEGRLKNQSSTNNQPQ